MKIGIAGWQILCALAPLHEIFIARAPLKMAVRNVDKIKSTKLNSYFSFMQGAKSANSELFKDFCNEAEMEKNS